MVGPQCLTVLVLLYSGNYLEPCDCLILAVGFGLERRLAFLGYLRLPHNDRFARAGLTEQYAVLRSVSEPRFYSDKIASCSVINRFRAFQMPGKRGRPRNHVCKVGVFSSQIERAISAKSPAGPGLEE